jgi:pyruvate/2-oxoglutarate dehydrogenase complex dihydrolipoamide dehydrogenase (E3) component
MVKIFTMKISYCFLLFTFLLFLQCDNNSSQKKYDLVVYGGTSGGIAAAIQASRMGKSVVIIEPGSRIGGLTTGGLGQTDIGNKAAIGGISREFYEGIKQYYANPENWKWQKKARVYRRRSNKDIRRGVSHVDL